MDPGVLMERALTAAATAMGFSGCECKAIPMASPGTCEEELGLSFCPCRSPPDILIYFSGGVEPGGQEGPPSQPSPAQPCRVGSGCSCGTGQCSEAANVINGHKLFFFLEISHNWLCPGSPVGCSHCPSCLGAPKDGVSIRRAAERVKPQGATAG